MKRPRVFAVLPTLLTLGNAASGFGAITVTARLGPEPLPGDETRLLIAALLIFLAMVFDALDGSAARWAGQTTDFGAQLDSLCDAISFGVAPAFLMLKFVDVPLLGGKIEAWFQYPTRLLWVIALLFVVCALLRLARFNVETEEDDTHESFSGLPSPAAAGTVASFAIALWGLRHLADPEQGAPGTFAEWLVPAMKAVLPLVTLGVACLMVSRIRYPHVFNQVFRGQRNRQHVIQVVFASAVVFQIRELAVPLIFCYYAFASPARAAWGEAARRGVFRKLAGAVRRDRPVEGPPSG